MNQCIRIIGGTYRGKKLTFAQLPDLRPTPNRVRETLFNWLMPFIRDARCLDAFAGSGALGFEAFSRGAQQVTFIEQSALAITHLKRHVSAFNTQALNVMQQDTRQFLTTTLSRFSIIFYDPPFTHAQFWQPDMIQHVHAIMEPDGLLYLESPTPMLLSPTQWLSLKQKKAGNVHYALFQKNSV